jgi:hypothetical protein
VRTLLLALGTLALVGCKGFHPVGPLAKQPPITQQGKPMPNTTPAASAAARVPAVKPTPPTMYVQPEDVNPDNARQMATRFGAELEADSKAPNAPVTVEVSRIQGRR